MDHLTFENKTLPDDFGSQQELQNNRINNVPETEKVNRNNIEVKPAKTDSLSDGYLLTTTSETNLRNGHSIKDPNPFSLELDSQNYNPLDIDSEYHNQYQSNRFLMDDQTNIYANEYFDKNINLFDLTPDQQLAIRELELRRQQAEYDDDYDFPLNYDQVLDYDVREKLESLNAQLANEPSPPAPEHRNSKVVFRDELVSLVAPAAEYELSESDLEEPNDRNLISDVGSLEVDSGTNYLSPVILSDGDHTPEPYPEKNEKILYEVTDQQSAEEKSIHDKESRNQLIKDKYSEEDANHNIVVSRGGQFQLMGQDDMMYSSEHIESSNSISLEREDRKPPKLRPISAPSTKRNRNEVWSNSQLDSSNSSVKSELNYLKQTGRSNSKMEVPRVDRDLLQRQKERDENRKKEQREREDLESKNRREMNEKCFHAWLQSKNKALKEESERKRKEEEEERKEKEKIHEERKINAQEKEKMLAKNLEQQKRREEKLRQYRIKEMEESAVVHTDNECKKAFKEWMKKKRQNHQLKMKEEKQKARITRLAMRQCRKSQNLAQAIHQANSFRYLDFYGYP